MRKFFENFCWVAGGVVLVDLIYPRLRGLDSKPFAETLIDATAVGLIVAGVFWFRNRRVDDNDI